MKILGRWKHARACKLLPHARANLLRPIRPSQLTDPKVPPRRLVLRPPQVEHAEHHHAACPELPLRRAPPKRGRRLCPERGQRVQFPTPSKRSLAATRKIGPVLRKPRHPVRVPRIFP